MTLQPGTTLARYRLIDEIGRGGMGVVWRARDTRLDRDVALKTLAPHLVGDASRRERFIREAKAAAAVSHPNIAAIFDVNEAEGVVYLAMELVEGRTLRELASGESLPIPKILSLAAQIAEGLGRAHREGIVHRDIKPDNVMVDDSGHLKILDFGLAKLRAAREEEEAAGHEEKETLEALTREGQTVGTVPYMSPEQTRGKPTDGRSDLFSLGTVLYELCTGRLPFRGETSMDTMSAILNESPKAPATLNPEVDGRLSELLDKCLQKEPGRRYQSAGDLAIDLRRLSEGTSSTFQEAAVAPLASSSGNLRWIAVVAFVVVAAVATAAWFSRSGERTPSAVEGEPAGAAVPAPITSLAVIPLDDHSEGAEQSYFADGMTESLIAEIAQVSDLRVISRTSVMQYRENRPSLKEIARELGVDAIVEGSVLRAEGRIRIIAQLIDARDDRHIWAGTYEREHEKVLTLQREVATAVAGEIEGALRPGEVRLHAKIRPIVPEAHALVLRGQQGVDLGTEEAIRRSLIQFRSALEIDPGYAMAWVGIATAWSSMANTYLPPREAMPQAKTAVLRALALDPGLAEAYETLAVIQTLFEWNFEAAERSRERALEINPNLAGAVLGNAFGLIGRGEREGVRSLIRKARELNPLSVGVGLASTWAFTYARDYEGALEMAEDMTERYPALSGGYLDMGVILALLGRMDEAVAVTERAVELNGNIRNLASLSWVQALAGREEEARRTLARQEDVSSEGYDCPYETALSWAALGEQDRAQVLFEQGIEERAICWVGGDIDPRVDPLLELPWFKALLARRTPMGPDDPDFIPLPPVLGPAATP